MLPIKARTVAQVMAAAACVALLLQLALAYARSPKGVTPSTALPSSVRVVVSLTSFATRVPRARTALRSLVAQSRVPNAIIMSVPLNISRIDVDANDNVDIANVLAELQKEFPTLTVRHPTDYGAATKLLGALEVEADPSTVIVCVDDDIEYHPDTIKTLVDALADPAVNGPTCFVCQYWPTWWFAVLRQRWPGECKGFLNAYAGVAYRVSFFTETGAGKDARNFDAPGVPSKECRLHDDVWLSGMLYRHGIRPFVVRAPFESVVNALPNTKYSINSVKNTEKEFRDPCLQYFNYFA